jgi:hypothetical protein
VGQVREMRLESWMKFHTYIEDSLFGSTHYIWRGQRDAAWTLSSGLDRFLEPVINFR